MSSSKWHIITFLIAALQLFVLDAAAGLQPISARFTPKCSQVRSKVHKFVIEGCKQFCKHLAVWYTSVQSELNWTVITTQTSVSTI